MINTQPIFIIGTGRSGTRNLFKTLSGVDDIEIFHEYNVLEVQQLSVLYYLGLITKKEAKKKLINIYYSAIYYCNKKIWIDSSNKCSWLIDILIEIFPKAKFVLVVRDGRKVVASFYYKLREEMYDDESNNLLISWLHNQNNPMPPKEKKFWWPVPNISSNKFKRFKKFNRFQRICFYWNECNSFILKNFKKLPKNKYEIFKLENLINNERYMKRFINFLDIDYDPLYYDFIQKPRNVFIPISFTLTLDQQKQFWQICKSTMNKFKYNENKIKKIKY